MSDERIAELSAELADLLKARFEGRSVLSSGEALLDYLRVRSVALRTEEVRVLYLDTRNKLIEDHVHASGTVDQCPVHIREIIHRALNLGATALIITHNHPSGDPTPSPQDVTLTRQLADACKHLRITLHDHVITGGTAAPVSMRARGDF